jgi:hypothetical protein
MRIAHIQKEILDSHLLSKLLKGGYREKERTQDFVFIHDAPYNPKTKKVSGFDFQN